MTDRVLCPVTAGRRPDEAQQLEAQLLVLV